MGESQDGPRPVHEIRGRPGQQLRPWGSCSGQELSTQQRHRDGWGERAAGQHRSKHEARGKRRLTVATTGDRRLRGPSMLQQGPAKFSCTAAKSSARTGCEAGGGGAASSGVPGATRLRRHETRSSSQNSRSCRRQEGEGQTASERRPSSSVASGTSRSASKAASERSQGVEQCLERGERGGGGGGSGPPGQDLLPHHRGLLPVPGRRHCCRRDSQRS